MPQPVSGQPSASTLSRIQLAKREAALREPGPLRPALMPAAMAGSWPSRAKPLGQGHDVGRIVLAVAIHGGDDGIASGPNAGPERGALPGPLPMPEIAQSRIFAEKRLDFSPRPVVARIVDSDHLAERRFRHLREGLLDQAADIAFLVKRWDDNGNTHEPGSCRDAANRR